jgi:hypothetical protein
MISLTLVEAGAAALERAVDLKSWRTIGAVFRGRAPLRADRGRGSLVTPERSRERILWPQMDRRGVE